jgi:hypothetical protein
LICFKNKQTTEERGRGVEFEYMAPRHVAGYNKRVYENKPKFSELREATAFKKNVFYCITHKVVRLKDN